MGYNSNPESFAAEAKRVEVEAQGTPFASADAYSRAGIGTVVRGCKSIAEAREKAGLDFTVEKRQHYFTSKSRAEDPRAIKKHDGSFALVRTDNEEPLADVGKGYTPFQPAELTDLIGALAADGALQPVEVAGSLNGGRRIFLLTPLAPTVLRGVDTVHKSLWFHAGFDGNSGVAARFATLRGSCLNSLMFGEAFAFNAAHTSTLHSKVAEVKRLLLNLPAQEAAVDARIRKLADKRMDPAEVQTYLIRVYVEAFKGRERAEAFASKLAEAVKFHADGKSVEFDPKYQHAVDTLGAWQANLMGPANVGVDGELGNGTAWHALNAVTQWVDHGRRTTVKGRANLAHVVGQPAAVKQHALKLALATVGGAA